VSLPSSLLVQDSYLSLRFFRGEGAVVIVIKSLEDAIRDHDHIYASVCITFNGFP